MKIKELRTACAMTQARFSELLGIPKRTIEDWENERRTPAEYLIKLIKYYLINEGYIEDEE